MLYHDHHQACDVYHQLRLRVANTLDSVKTRQSSLSAFDRILELFRRTPISPAEFQSTRRRVRGAKEYCRAGEHGAASYELRTLLRAIDRLFSAHLKSIEDQGFVVLCVPEHPLHRLDHPPTPHA